MPRMAEFIFARGDADAQSSYLRFDAIDDDRRHLLYATTRRSHARDGRRCPLQHADHCPIYLLFSCRRRRIRAIAPASSYALLLLLQPAILSRRSTAAVVKNGILPLAHRYCWTAIEGRSPARRSADVVTSSPFGMAYRHNHAGRSRTTSVRRMTMVGRRQGSRCRSRRLAGGRRRLRRGPVPQLTLSHGSTYFCHCQYRLLAQSTLTLRRPGATIRRDRSLHYAADIFDKIDDALVDYIDEVFMLGR